MATDPDPLQDFCVADLDDDDNKGVSMNRVDFAPGGTNPPHVHPRATEIGLVMKGELLVGIIGSNESGNKLYSRVVRAGENFLIPRGLMHFQFNVGKTEAYMVVAFNSQNPGIVFVLLALRLQPAYPDAGAHQGAPGGRRGCRTSQVQVRRRVSPGLIGACPRMIQYISAC
ncbi:hypothetical protein ZWY2020_051001 [Hordeum vulgare]|nr:hypothetical protein ZWY2020_051001 [Hordeum vulgare]